LQKKRTADLKKKKRKKNSDKKHMVLGGGDKLSSDGRHWLVFRQPSSGPGIGLGGNRDSVQSRQEE